MNEQDSQAYHVPEKTDPVIDAITERITPLVLIHLLAEQGDEGLAENTTELVCHLIEQLVIVAVRHGASTDPERWDFVADHLVNVGMQLMAERSAS